MALALLYLNLIFTSIIGMAFQLYFKSMSQQDMAKKANIEYSIKAFLIKDRKAIIGTFLTLCLFFLLFGEAINSVVTHSSTELSPYFWGLIMLSPKMIATFSVKVICVTVAYMGQDVALRFLGRTSKEIRAVIDEKTTKADLAEGTIDKPTPIK
jgi:uncharacterized membrane protein